MFEIVVRALIQDKTKRVLLAKRAKKPEQHKWALVGGKVEMNEKSIEAVVREVKEELNIDFLPRFEFYGENLFPELHCLILYFSGEYSGSIQTKLDEILEVKFFSRSEIKAMENIAWDHKKVVMERLNTNT